eukprot:CAMPEP_0184987790 /NCGR_PEP_ID=MMETSP1098-20130426/21903_1 /TAXON_ID=89044 /ORGANISM="Spumella elongata, Strain CCAP 955/1" /LENGTH=54 /DNA_ID=CAMNT_0027512385 /DNA_START=70 /DNA_END=230 /DNA_ORIENTATION=+
MTTSSFFVLLDAGSALFVKADLTARKGLTAMVFSLPSSATIEGCTNAAKVGNKA